MKKIFTVLLFLKLIVFAQNYNDFLLRIQSKIYPKIILLDKKIDKKLINGKIMFGIVYDNDDFFIAQRVKELIKKIYGSRLDRYEFKIIPIEMLNILDSKYADYSYLYILKSIPDRLKQLSLFVKKHNIITFTYDKEELKYGFLFSLDIEKKPIIYMNKKVLNKDLEFTPYLYRIVRFYK